MRGGADPSVVVHRLPESQVAFVLGTVVSQLEKRTRSAWVTLGSAQMTAAEDLGFTPSSWEGGDPPPGCVGSAWEAASNAVASRTPASTARLYCMYLKIGLVHQHLLEAHQMGQHLTKDYTAHRALCGRGPCVGIGAPHTLSVRACSALHIPINLLYHLDTGVFAKIHKQSTIHLLKCLLIGLFCRCRAGRS